MHDFSLWAPRPRKVAVRVGDQTYPMQGPDRDGLWKASVEAPTGTEYGFLLDDDPMVYPDPHSLLQPRGVHGPSVIYNHRDFQWDDSTWQGSPFGGAVVYELHIGTFTAEGTFDAALARLPNLFDLGITHV